MVQAAGPAIQDLGVYDLEKWGGSFNEIYKEMFSALFDKDRKFRKNLIPILKELNKESFCAADSETLARSMARIGGTLAFNNMAMNRNK